MKKFYEEPEMIIRNYILPPDDIVKTSEIDPDPVDPWNPNAKAQNYFE